MARAGTTVRLATSVAGLLLAASAAQAIPSIAIKWRSSGTATLVSPAATSTQVADIVLTTVTQVVNGVFISIEFDNVELTAIAAREVSSVNLPGMGNVFRPISPGTTIDNASGLVTLFDTGTSSTGLAGGHVRTLGSVTFQIVAAWNSSADIDVIASLQNSLFDDVVGLTEAIGANFVGAAVSGPLDSDMDGVADSVDNCPFHSNPGQEDTDGYGLADACNSVEDWDGDEWANSLDNCTLVANPDQADLNNNGIGDVCEVAVPSSSPGVLLFLTLVLLVIGHHRIPQQPRARSR